MRFIKIYLLLFALLNTSYAAKITDPVLTVGKDAATDFTILHKDGGYLKKTGSQGDWLFSNDGILEKKIGSGSGSGGDGGINILPNNGFEDGLADWTTSGGTFTQETYTNSIESDTKYARFVSTTPGEYVESSCVDVPDNFDVGGMADIKYLGGSGSFDLKVFDCTASDIEISTAVLADIASWLKSPTQTFSMPSKVKLRIISTAAGSIDFDNTYTGSNKGFISGTYTNSVKLSGNSGEVVGAGTKTPFLGTGTGWNVDEYTVQRSNSVVSISAGTIFTGATTRSYDLYLNGSIHQRISQPVSNDAHAMVFISKKGEFVPGDLLSIRLAQGSGTLSNNPTYHYININEKSAETTEAFTPDQSDFFVSGSIYHTGGSNLSPAVTSTPVIWNNSSLQMVLNKGAAQIPCSGGNPSTGLVCSTGNEQVGVVVDIKRSGRYKVCFTDVSRTGSTNVLTHRIFSTTGPATDVLDVASTAVSANRGTNVDSSHRTCHTYDLSSTGKKKFVFAYEADSVDAQLLLDRNANSSERDFSFTVELVSSYNDRPIIQNMVSSPIISGVDIVGCGVDNAGLPWSTGDCSEWISSITLVSGASERTRFTLNAKYSGRALVSCSSDAHQETSQTSQTFTNLMITPSFEAPTDLEVTGVLSTNGAGNGNFGRSITCIFRR